MRRQIGSILLSCMMGAALLSGCTFVSTPATSGTSPDSSAQSEQEVPSSSESAASAPTASSQATQPTVTLSPQPIEAPAESAVPSMDNISGDEKAPSSVSSSEKTIENSSEPTEASSNDETSDSDDDFVYYESLEDFPELNLSIDETGNSLCKDGVGWFAAPGLWQISGEMVSDGRIIGIKILYEGNPEDFTWQFFDSTDLSITFPQCYEIDLSNKEIERIDHRTIYFAGGDTLSF